MTDKELLEAGFNAFFALPPDEAFLSMQRSGLIKASGEPQLWDAHFAIVATNATSTQVATHFRCLKPVFGLPGSATIDVSRDSMVYYLGHGERIITAITDSETDALLEGPDVHLVAGKWLRTDPNEITADNLGDLPRFSSVESRM